MLTDVAEILHSFVSILFTHILKILGPGQVRSRSLTSYMMSFSDEIGTVCDLSYLGEFHCFLEWVFAQQAALMVLMDIEKPSTVPRGQGHTRSRLPWAVSVAHFDSYFF